MHDGSVTNLEDPDEMAQTWAKGIIWNKKNPYFDLCSDWGETAHVHRLVHLWFLAHVMKSCAVEFISKERGLIFLYL